MRDYAKTKNLLLVIYACTIIHEHFKLGRRWCSMTINGQDCYYNFVMSYNKIYYVCNKNCYDCNNICYGTYITILISVMRSLSIWSGWIYMHMAGCWPPSAYSKLILHPFWNLFWTCFNFFLLIGLKTINFKNIW